MFRIRGSARAQGVLVIWDLRGPHPGGLVAECREELEPWKSSSCLAMVEETLSFGDGDGSESAPLGGPSSSSSGGPPLDERILSVVRRAKKEADGSGLRRITPAHLSSELGLSVEDATRELCGLLAAVGSGAGFVFERPQLQTSWGLERTSQLPIVPTNRDQLRRRWYSPSPTTSNDSPESPAAAPTGKLASPPSQRRS